MKRHAHHFRSSFPSHHPMDDLRTQKQETVPRSKVHKHPHGSRHGWYGDSAERGLTNGDKHTKSLLQPQQLQSVSRVVETHRAAFAACGQGQDTQHRTQQPRPKEESSSFFFSLSVTTRATTPSQIHATANRATHTHEHTCTLPLLDSHTGTELVVQTFIF